MSVFTGHHNSGGRQTIAKCASAAPVLALLALALLGPARAEAGSVQTNSSFGFPQVVFTGNGIEVNRVTISYEPGVPQPFRVIDTGAPLQVVGTGCTAVTSNEATCSGDDSTRPAALLNGGDDTFTWGSAAIPSPAPPPGGLPHVLSAQGGDGDDSIVGSPGPDILEGGGAAVPTAAGSDADSLIGGGGDDSIRDREFSAQEGVAHLVGGEGNDRFTVTSTGGTKLLEGGDGDDLIEMQPWGTPSAPATPLATPGSYLLDAGPGNDRGYGVTLDRNGGAVDENAGGVAEVFRGGPGDDTFAARGGADILEGGDGNDRLEGGDDHDVVTGEAGDDGVLGGAGDDDLQGGVGNDYLLGDKGADTLAGGPGIDLLKAIQPPFVPGAIAPSPGYNGSGTNEAEAEPEPDSLSCGDDRDVAIADPTDQILADCEQLGTETACPIGTVGACEAILTLETSQPSEAGSAKAPATLRPEPLEIGTKKLKVRPELAAQIEAALSKKGKRLLAKRGKLRVRITLELISKTKKKTKRYVRRTKVTLFE